MRFFKGDFVRSTVCFFLIFSFFFSGCNSFFNRNYSSDTISKKKMQASRKDAIIKDNKVLVTTVVTYLNDVSALAYYNREYFFIEIYNEDQVDYSNVIDYTLNGRDLLWIREIKSDEFDEILHPNNKWSRCYLVAFKGVSELETREMVLEMSIGRIGTMHFDFSLKIVPLSM